MEVFNLYIMGSLIYAGLALLAFYIEHGKYNQSLPFSYLLAILLVSLGSWVSLLLLFIIAALDK